MGEPYSLSYAIDGRRKLDARCLMLEVGSLMLEIASWKRDECMGRIYPLVSRYTMVAAPISRA